MSVDVSVVVVAYRRAGSLERLLVSLDSDGDTGIEVVVVNVDDDPDVRVVCRQFRSLVSRVVAVPNRGFAAAVNAGVTQCRRSVVVVSNDDIVFGPDAVRVLAQRARSTGGVSAPQVRTPSGSVQRTVTASVSLVSLAVESALLPDRPVPLPWGLGQRVAKWRVPEHAERVPSVSGCAFAVPRCLIVSEPLPEQYFMYWEERDWLTRLGWQGVPVWYLPEVFVVHAGGSSEVRGDKQRWLARNAILCIRSLYGGLAGFFARPIVFAWHVRLVLQALVGVEPRLAGARIRGLTASVLPVRGGA